MVNYDMRARLQPVVTRRARSNSDRQWEALLSLVMAKAGIDSVEITQADLDRYDHGHITTQLANGRMLVRRQD